MNVERAAEIIAAYGGDASRWPDSERAAALQLVESDAVLAQARRDASALDTEMSMWSQQPAAGLDVPGAAQAAAARALAGSSAMRPAVRPVWRWAVGTGMAAALAAGVMFMHPHAERPRMQVVHSAAADAAAFAMVFTPTPDEDGSI